MAQAAIGIGTNIGDRRKNLRDAVKSVSLLPGTEVLKVSSVYETEPVGYSDQPDFLNICIIIKTRLSPNALLGACLGIEAAMGRERSFTNAPRVIDLDLLLYEDFSLDAAELTVPHPRMFERDFVMVPLSEIADGTFVNNEFGEKIKKFFSDPSIQHLRVSKSGKIQDDV